ERGLQEFRDVAIVLLDESVLAAAGIDDQTEAQRQLGFTGEETDGLRDAVVEDFEIVLVEVADDLAARRANTGGDVDQLGLGLERGPLLCNAEGPCDKEGEEQAKTGAAHQRLTTFPVQSLTQQFEF